MNNRNKRQILLNVFGVGDESAAINTCQYRILYEDLEERFSGICSHEGCSTPMSYISFTGDLLVDDLRDGRQWSSFCRRHKLSLLGCKSVSPIVESSSRFAPLPSTSFCHSSEGSCFEVEFLHLHGVNK